MDKRRGKLGDGAQALRRRGGDGAVRMNKEHRVAKAAALPSITASHCRSVSASLISPASTAHSMPLE